MFKLSLIACSSFLFLNACGPVASNIQSKVEDNSKSIEKSSEELGLSRPRSTPAGYSYEGIGFTMKSLPSDRNPVYRLFNPSNGDHLYTKSIDEVTSAVKNDGYKFEGIGFMEPKSGNSLVSVHRFYQPSTGNHFYTASLPEKNDVMRTDYRYEGVAFNAACFGGCENRANETVNIHRFYNGRDHFYSITGL